MSNSINGLNPELANGLSSLMNETGGKVGITSGARDSAEQQSLYDAAVKKYGAADAGNWAAKPGSSNHEKGQAADISGWQSVTDQQLAKYGLYRPMSWEPWHVERIGYRSGKDAYTTPRVPNNDHATKVLNNFGDAIAQLGLQPSNVGEQAPTLGTQQSVVGENPVVAPAQSQAPTEPGAATAQGAGGDIDRFMQAISGKESGGNYNATNKDSGAQGRFQIMPANWPEWSQEAGLGPAAPRSPENQDRVARFKMQQYYNQFGNWKDVATAWYGGPGAVGLSDAAKNKQQGNYPSINQYSNDVLKRMG